MVNCLWDFDYLYQGILDIKHYEYLLFSISVCTPYQYEQRQY